MNIHLDAIDSITSLQDVGHVGILFTYLNVYPFRFVAPCKKKFLSINRQYNIEFGQPDVEGSLMKCVQMLAEQNMVWKMIIFIMALLSIYTDFYYG